MAAPSEKAAGEAAAVCSTSEVPDSQHMGTEVSGGSTPHAHGLSSDSERAHGSSAALSQLPRELSSPRGLRAVPTANVPAANGQLPPPATGAPADLVPTGTLHKGRILSHGISAPPLEPPGESVSTSEGALGGHVGGGNGEAPSAPPLRNMQRIRSLMDPRAPGLSMHGEEAFRRQGMSELIFFAAVGDMQRCKKIAEKYKLEVC